MNSFKYAYFLIYCTISIYSSLHAELLIVNSTGDESALNPCVSACAHNGLVTLRSSLERAAANSDTSNIINFAIPQIDNGYTNVTDHWIIEPKTSLPVVAHKQLIVDGYTQLGAKTNCNSIDQEHNGQLKIELRGPGPTVVEKDELCDGFDFIVSDGSVVRGLIFSNFASFMPDAAGFGFGGSALFVYGTNDMKIEGCFFGVDQSGTINLPNANAVLFLSCSNCSFGGSVPAARNLASGSYAGLGVLQCIASNALKIQGNTFGLDRLGRSIISGYDSSSNVVLYANNNCLIGGEALEERNVIAGGSFANIYVSSNDDSTIIKGNYLGTDITGLKNFDENGIGILVDKNAKNTVIENNKIFSQSKGILLGSNACFLLPPSHVIICKNIISVPNKDDAILADFAKDVLVNDNTIET